MNMKADVLLTAVIEIDAANSERNLARQKRRWELNLLISITAAAVTGMFGLLFSAAVFANLFPHDGRLSILGSILLAVSFPLLVLSAHCLDRIDEAKHARRSADLKRRLFKN
jgi:hypothetical protein